MYPLFLFSACESQPIKMNKFILCIVLPCIIAMVAVHAQQYVGSYGYPAQTVQYGRQGQYVAYASNSLQALRQARLFNYRMYCFTEQFCPTPPVHNLSLSLDCSVLSQQIFFCGRGYGQMLCISKNTFTIYSENEKKKRLIES